MKLFDELFKGYQVKEGALLPYGFLLDEEGYRFQKPIHDGDFELSVFVIGGQISGKLIDKDFEEEYARIDMDIPSSFAALLKEECSKTLLDIRKHCFTRILFLDPQSVRVANYIHSTYGDEPEFLFKDDPYTAVFRNKGNGKWYGIIMDVKEDKLAPGVSSRTVINVKVDPTRYEELLRIDGIYPGWHMNKKTWISVSLSDHLEDPLVESLIDMSYRMVSKSK